MTVIPENSLKNYLSRKAEANYTLRVRRILELKKLSPLDLFAQFIDLFEFNEQSKRHLSSDSVDGISSDTALYRQNLVIRANKFKTVRAHGL